jgi:tRNA-specific 2-thiouridylase
MHWVLDKPARVGDKLMAQVRYRQQKQACTIMQATNDKVVVRFDNRQRAVTLGQSLVLFEGNFCLGGGFISDYS